MDGHSLRGATPTGTSERVYRSPFIDALTLDFAAAAAQRLQLGEDDVPDLLAISLSGTDTVGHEFGPESHEAHDALLRLDAWLGRWLEALEARVGHGRIVLALSSDHGVLPIPEWLSETDRSRCPVQPARIELSTLRQELHRHLRRELGHWYARPRRWLLHAGLQLTVDRANAAAAGVEVDRVIAVAEAWLEARPEIVAAWTAAEQAASADPMAQRYRRSHDPALSGDLALQPAADCLVSLYPAGTSHGAPYDYDIEVPIVLWGAGVAPGRDERAAGTVDVAPTLARLLGIAAPDDLDGVSLVD
jgi:arylsulfatase A-like enzyme